MKFTQHETTIVPLIPNILFTSPKSLISKADDKQTLSFPVAPN